MINNIQKPVYTRSISIQLEFWPGEIEPVKPLLTIDACVGTFALESRRRRKELFSTDRQDRKHEITSHLSAYPPLKYSVVKTSPIFRNEASTNKERGRLFIPLNKQGRLPDASTWYGKMGVKSGCLDHSKDPGLVERESQYIENITQLRLLKDRILQERSTNECELSHRELEPEGGTRASRATIGHLNQRQSSADKIHCVIKTKLTPATVSPRKDEPTTRNFLQENIKRVQSIKTRPSFGGHVTKSSDDRSNGQHGKIIVYPICRFYLQDRAKGGHNSLEILY